jgi:hypothetical protein
MSRKLAKFDNKPHFCLHIAMYAAFKKVAEWFVTPEPQLKNEDKILSFQQVNHIRLLTKRADNDDLALKALKDYFNEALIIKKTENYTQIQQKMIVQLDSNPRIPSEFVQKFAFKPVIELLKPER